MDKTQETLELLKRVAPIMQSDPRYIFTINRNIT